MVMNDYSMLVQIAIKNAHERYDKKMGVRKVHISKVLKRIVIKYPNFTNSLYSEIFDYNNQDEYGRIVSSVYRIKLMNLISVMEKKYNIKVWGHVETWRGDVLDLNDIRQSLSHVLSEMFIQISPVLYSMIDNGILKSMEEWGDENG